MILLLCVLNHGWSHGLICPFRRALLLSVSELSDHFVTIPCKEHLFLSLVFPLLSSSYNGKALVARY